MQKLLILGGTGAMGIPLVELLTGKKDFEVYITSRKNHQSRDNVYHIKGDAHDIVL